MIINTVYLTNFGKSRVKNEDSILIQDQVIYETDMEEAESKVFESSRILLSVADGMGGHMKGEIASRSVLLFLGEHMADVTSSKAVRKTILRSKELLNSIASETRAFGLGTTLSGFLFKGKKSILFNCGDSRIYKVKGENLERLTKDHSVVQVLYNHGLIDEDGMRTHPSKNLLTSAIIGDSSPQTPVVTVEEIEIREGDKFLLCTDGLWESMTSQELRDIFFNYETLTEKAFALKELALERGGRDNLSLIIVEVLEV